MSQLDELQQRYEAAEAKAHKLQADRDEALAKVRDRFNDRLRAAVDDAAQAQQELLDAQVLDSLADRPETERDAFAATIRQQSPDLAERLGLNAG